MSRRNRRGRLLGSSGSTALCTTTAIAATALTARAESMPKVYKKLIRPTGKGNPRNGEGDIIELKDGRLLLAYSHWYKGKGHDDAPAEIRATTSADGGPGFTGPTDTVGRATQ